MASSQEKLSQVTAATVKGGSNQSDDHWGAWDETPKTTPTKVSPQATPPLSTVSGDVPNSDNQSKTMPSSKSTGKSQIESLSHEELVKYVKKQTILLQKMKVRLDDLTQEHCKLKKEAESKTEATPADNEYLVQEVQVLKSERDMLQTELKNVKQIVLSLEQEKQTQVSSLEDQIAHLTTEKTALQESFSQISATMATEQAKADEEKAALRETIEGLQLAVKDITEAKDQLAEEMELLRDSYNKLQVERERAKNEVVTLEEELNQKMEGWAHERERLNTEIAQFQVDSKTVIDLREELKEWKEKAKRFEEEIVNVKEERDQSLTVNQSIVSELEMSKEQVKLLQESGNEKERQLIAMETQLEATKEEREQLTQQFEELRTKETEETRAECRQLREEQEKLMSTINGLENELLQYRQQEQHHSPVDDEQSLRDEVTQLRQEYDDLNSRANDQAAEHKEEVKKLKAYAVKLKKELAEERSLRQHSNESLHDLREKEVNVEEMKASLDKAVTDHCNVSQELTKEQQKVQQLVSDVKKLTEEKERVEHSFHTLEDEHVSLRSELESIKTTLLSTQSDLARTKRELDTSTAETKSLNETLTREKEEHDSTRQKLIATEKEAKSSSLMTLELADYQRSLEALRGQIKDKEMQQVELEKKLTSLQKENEELSNEFASCKDDSVQKDEIIAKMKAMLRKSSKELNETKAQMTESHQKAEDIRKELEATKQNLEVAKVEIASLTAKFQSDIEQSQSSQNHYKCLVHSLEAKVLTLQSEVTSSAETLQMKEKEFESYKVRVHSVLKQKETLPSVTEIETSLRQQHEVELLKTKAELKETRERLTAVLSEHTELEQEYQQLSGNFENLVHDNELAIQQLKDKLRETEERYTVKIRELEDINSQRKLEVIENTTAFKSQIYSMQNEYQAQLKSLQSQLQLAHDDISRRQQEADAAVLAKGPSTTVTKETTKPLTEAKVIPTEERSAGEGMDRIELEVSGLATPTATPIGEEQFVSFERLLSTSSTDLVSLSGRSQTSQSETSDEFRQTVKSLNKKVIHVTELLHESEANCVRLTDQTKLLKEEIRRLERNQERQKEAASNMEYLKNVVLKFLQSTDAERTGLIPIISRLLQLSQQEKQYLQDTLKGKKAELPDPMGDNPSGYSPSNKGWTNYLQRWTGYS